MSDPSNLLSPASSNKRRTVAIGSSSVPNKKRRKQEDLEEPHFLGEVASPGSDGETEEDLDSYLRNTKFHVEQDPDDEMKKFLDELNVTPFRIIADKKSYINEQILKDLWVQAREYEKKALTLAKESMRMSEKARLHRKHGQAKCLVLSKEYEELLAKAAEKKDKLEMYQGYTAAWSQRERTLNVLHSSIAEAGQEALQVVEDFETMSKMPLEQRKCARMNALELRKLTGLVSIEDIRNGDSEPTLKSALYLLQNHGFEANPLCPIESIDPDQSVLVKPLLALFLGFSMAEIEEAGFGQSEMDAFEALGICAGMSIPALRSFTGFDDTLKMQIVTGRVLLQAVTFLKEHGFEQNSLCPLKKISPTMMRSATKPCMAWLMGFSMAEITAAGFDSRQMATFHKNFVPPDVDALAQNGATSHQQSIDEVEYAGTELGDSDWDLIFAFRDSTGNQNQAKIASEGELRFVRNMRGKQTFLSPVSSRQVNQPRSILRSSSSAHGSREGHARHLKHGSTARQKLSQSDQSGSMLARSWSSTRGVRDGSPRRLKNGTPTRPSLSQPGLSHCPPHLGASSSHHYNPPSREYDSDAARRHSSARQSLFSSDADGHSVGRHGMGEENQGLSPHRHGHSGKQDPQSPSFGR